MSETEKGNLKVAQLPEKEWIKITDGSRGWALEPAANVDERLPVMTTHQESCGRDLWKMPGKIGTIAAVWQILPSFGAVKGRMVMSIGLTFFSDEAPLSLSLLMVHKVFFRLIH